MARVLLAGESWISASFDFKGFDVFPHTQLEIGCEQLLVALAEHGHEVTHLRAHDVARDFPMSLAGLAEYDVVVLSDVGANSLLHPDTFTIGKPLPNRMHLISEWVNSGGGLMMAGGYQSFQGFQARAGYFGTPIEKVLPVSLFPYDDRVEAPQGVTPIIEPVEHVITEALRGLEVPSVLGYQRLKAKGGASVLMTVEGDPFLTVAAIGEGRSLAYATDVSPHWAPPAFMEWDGYGTLMNSMIQWLDRRSQ